MAFVMKTVRIVDPPARRRESAPLAELQADDVFEFTDESCYAIDPKTKKRSDRLQRFVVIQGESIAPIG